jgi:molybdopterin-guanine dinucleotide biosynthesis protein A
MASFSAALLVGGQSKRMGRDKALMRDSVSGQVLWQRQLRILEELQPEEIFWSGPARPGIPADPRLVEDSIPHAGPLAGISACLNVLRSDLLVVLAIDLPQMNAAFLKRLLASCTPTCGVAMKRDFYFEPLAAVYPKAMGALAEAHLHQGRYALQDLLGEADLKGMMHSIQLGDENRSLFKNVNAPDDL